MIHVWFFLAYIINGGGVGLAQAGPFMTQQQCEDVRNSFSSSGFTKHASQCYQGVWSVQ